MDNVPTMDRSTIPLPVEVKEEKPASNKITYNTLFWLFIFGSVIGFFLEGIWSIYKRGAWENHAATVWGPFCIIYGVGAAAVYVISALTENKNLFLRFALFAASGTLVEFLFSLFQELLFGSTSWNYSKHFMNIDGRVSLDMTLIWGILGTLFSEFAFRRLKRLFDRTKTKSWRTVCAVLSVFMVVNLLFTSAAVLRWRSRRTEGTPAKNRVEHYLDENYDNDAMKMLFPNLRFKKR